VPKSRPDIPQRFSEAVDCFAERRASILNRITVSIFVATLHSAFTSVEQSLFWLFGVLLTQYFEFYYGRKFLSVYRIPSFHILTIYRILCFTATLVYSLIIPFIWFGWGEAGPLFSLMALSGAILHAVLTQSASKRLLLYTILPHAIWLITLPSIHILEMADHKILSLTAVSAVILLFIHHAFHASSIHRQTLTHYKENEDRERLLREESETLSEEKTNLIRNLSHEFRTPLNGVIGTLEILAQNKSLDDLGKTEVDICRQSAFDLYRIANKRLELFGTDINAPNKNSPPLLDANDLLEKISLATKKLTPSIDLEVQLNANLTSIENTTAYQPILVSLFPLLVRQFANESKISKLMVSVEEELLKDGSVAVFFSLHFSAQLNAKFFDSLYLKEPMEEEPEQNTIFNDPSIIQCLEICDQLNLIISTESYDENHEIRIELPAYFLKSSIQSEQVSENSTNRFDQKILIVDDNKTNRHIASRMLETMNIPSISCNDGIEAVSLAKNERFTAFLMDIQMPVMDGVSATEAIRKIDLNKKTPVIAISANCQKDMREKFDAVGINAFLEKPYTRTQLKTTLSKFNIFEQGIHQMSQNESTIDITPNDISVSDNIDTPESIELKNSSTVLDLEMLSELEDALDLDGTIEIIETCLEELAELCTEYDQKENSQDEIEQRRIAHKIKGCASSACASALTTVAALIENADSASLQSNSFSPDLMSALEKTKFAFQEKYHSISTVA